MFGRDEFGRFASQVSVDDVALKACLQIMPLYMSPSKSTSKVIVIVSDNGNLGGQNGCATHFAHVSTMIDTMLNGDGHVKQSFKQRFSSDQYYSLKRLSVQGMGT